MRTSECRRVYVLAVGADRKMGNQTPVESCPDKPKNNVKSFARVVPTLSARRLKNLAVMEHVQTAERAETDGNVFLQWKSYS